MNEPYISEDVFSVVKLDGEECKDIKLETINEWYFNRKINDSSLIFSSQTGKWQMLKKLINVDDLKSEFYGGYSSTSLPNYQDFATNQTENDYQEQP